MFGENIIANILENAIIANVWELVFATTLGNLNC